MRQGRRAAALLAAMPLLGCMAYPVATTGVAQPGRRGTAEASKFSAPPLIVRWMPRPAAIWAELSERSPPPSSGLSTAAISAITRATASAQKAAMAMAALLQLAEQ